jgi:hypothetical protein
VVARRVGSSPSQGIQQGIDMQRFGARFGLFAFTATTALLLSSCGEQAKRYPETGATLEGTITYGKQPVPLALVIVAAEGSSATAKADEEGRYKVENAPLGEVNIGVNTDAAQGELRSKMMAGAYKGPEARGAGKAVMPKLVAVPARFFSPETSGIKTTVDKGDNTYNIVISK